jgi:hypothetical protein
MAASDGKQRLTDVATAETLLHQAFPGNYESIPVCIYLLTQCIQTHVLCLHHLKDRYKP